MSWRTIVITKRAKLDLQLGFMVVRGEHDVKMYGTQTRLELYLI